MAIRIRGLVWILAATFGSAGPLQAETYRLVMGDQVTLNYNFLNTPTTTTVDLDGEIRLAELGRITAAGRTLDEVEEAITQGMIDGGFSGFSFVSVEVAEYAPIIVSGYVEEAGQFTYTAGVTAGAALALAGGPPRAAAIGGNGDAQLFAAGRRLAAAARDLAQSGVEIVALETALEGPAATLPPIDLSEIPAEHHGLVDKLLSEKQALLAVERERSETLLASWDGEREDIDRQIALLGQRITLKQEIVASLESEVADIEQLRSQGLTTIDRLSTQQQRLADDREELLALQIAQVQAERARATSERDRITFLTTQRQVRLDELSAARAAQSTARRSLSLAREELAFLLNSADDIPESDLLFARDLTFSLQGPRADRLGRPMRAEDRLLPGDILVVGLASDTPSQ